MSVSSRTVFVGDNLPVLRGMEAESVDMVYADPPFNSNRISHRDFPEHGHLRDVSNESISCPRISAMIISFTNPGWSKLVMPIDLANPAASRINVIILR